MYFRPSVGEEFDGVERRPRLWDDARLLVDTGELRRRKERNAELRRSKRNTCFCAALADEIAFAQLFYSPTATDPVPWRPGKAHWRLFPSQFGFYTDEIVIGHCGRDIGKTTSMKQILPQKMIWYENSNAIFTSHDQDHVNDAMTKVFQVLDEHPFFALFLHPGDGSRSRRHPQYQRMRNGFQMYGISGGQTESAASKVESPHVNIFFGDEFQRYTVWAWRKVQNSINDLKINRKNGACFKVYGVNSEGRIDTVFYELGHKMMPFKAHAYRIASWDTPRYSLDQHVKNLGSLGHSIQANEFKQQIRGLTGERTTGVFQEEEYLAAVDLWHKLDRGGAQYRFRRVTRKIWDSRGGSCPDIFGDWFVEPKEAIQCVISADYGESAPTELGLWYEFNHPTGPDTVWALMARAEITGIGGSEQAEIFDYLMDQYGVSRCSVDSTASSCPIYSILTGANDTRYNWKNYRARIHPAKMNENVTVDYYDEKPPDAFRSKKDEVDGETVWAVLQSTNVFSTNEIRRMMAEGRLAIPEDEMIRREFMTLVAKEAPNGAIKYGGNQEHIISMFRCFTILMHNDYTLEEKRKEFRDRYLAEPATGVFFNMEAPMTRDLWGDTTFSITPPGVF